jgi:predicted ribosomally synthesized peptide with SipW-like signal peptide
MTKKSMKRALLLSALSIVMCVAMLVGSTYAWFTDEVTSANNIIKSGTLKVGFEWANGKEDPTSANWTDASAGPIFNNDLWEPGYTEARHIKIVNKGTLALAWNLAIVPNGEVSALGDVIDVYVADEATQVADRNDLTALEYKGTLTEWISTGIVAGKLGKGETYSMTIVLKMSEEAGNEYQGLSIGSDFAVKLIATQLSFESDSYDNLYDKDAVFCDVIVSTTEELEAAIEAGKKVIGVKGTAVELAAAQAGKNRDMNGITLVGASDDATITVTGTGGGLDNINMKNIKVVDSTFYTSENGENAWEFTYLELGGNSTFVNVAFDDGIMSDGPMSTFVDCTFSGHNNDSSTYGNTTMYGAWVYSGKATFVGCYFSGTRGLKVCDQYAGEASKVVVDSCVFGPLSEKPGLAIDDREDSSFNIVIKNCYFIDCQKGDQELYIYETDNYVPVLENNTVLNNASFISTKEEFLALSAKAFTDNNGKSEEKTFVLNADIDLEGAEFSAMIAQRGDTLNFVGNGHKISNVKIVSGAGDNTTGQASMFYAFPNSTLNVSNLTIENATVTAEANDTGYAAAVIGYCEGNVILNNVDVVNATVTGVKSSGMLAGHLSGKLVATDCDLSGTVTLAGFAGEAAGHYAGKYFGTLAGAATLENCTVNATVSGNLKAGNIGDVYGRMTAAGSLN